MSHWMISKMMIDARHNALLHEADQERLARSRGHRESRPARKDDRATRPATTLEACCADSGSVA